MSGDEFVHREAHWTSPSVGIVPLEIERALAGKELAHRVDDEAIGAARVGREGVDDDAIALAALIVAQPGAAFDPLARDG
jgi:hypothetical protein